MYISQDPIRVAGGNKLYSYVYDTNAWVDIFGLTGNAANVTHHNGYVLGSYEDVAAYNKENNLNASSHHIVQDAAVNSLPNYDRNTAPAISLDDKYGTKDSAHYKASEVQRNATTSDLGNEKIIGSDALAAAGVPEDVIAEAEKNVNDYFSNIGANDNDCVNTPKNRS